MSHKNLGGCGALLSGIAALITSVVGFLVFLDLKPKPPNEYKPIPETNTPVIRSDHKSVSAYYNNRGLDYYNKKDYDFAIADYSQALILNPNDTNAYNNRGYTYVYKEDYDRAITDLNQAIKLNPNYAYAYGSRCEAYHKKGNNDSAIADCDQAIKLDPTLTDSYYNRGLAYRNKGSNDNAVVDFKKVLELNNNQDLSQKASQKLQELSTK